MYWTLLIVVPILVIVGIGYFMKKPKITIEDALADMEKECEVTRSSNAKGTVEATLKTDAAKFKIHRSKRQRTITVKVRGRDGVCKLWIADCTILARCTLWYWNWGSQREALDEHQQDVVRAFFEKAVVAAKQQPVDSKK